VAVDALAKNLKKAYDVARDNIKRYKGKHAKEIMR
jgi:hypothetical protein